RERSERGGKGARHCTGEPPNLPTDETHHQDHVRSGDRLRHGENIGEILIGHPAVGADDKVADIGQDSPEPAKADRRYQGEMHRQGERGRWAGHRALAFSIPAMAILRGTKTNKTPRSGSLAKAMRPKASPAKSSAAGRRLCGKRSLMPVAISRPAAVAAMPPRMFPRTGR